MENSIILKDFGAILDSDRKGTTIANLLKKRLETLSDGESLIVDLSNIEIMTPRFIKKTFGEIAVKIALGNYKNKSLVLIGNNNKLEDEINRFLLTFKIAATTKTNLSL